MSAAADLFATLGELSEIFRPCNLSRQTTESDVSPEELVSGVWSDAAGWIARESRVISASSNIAQADDPTQGKILEAELCLATRSLQIRRLPGRWLLTEITETSGDEVLADDRLVATVRHGIARYRRYWTVPTDGAVDVIACRLTGFEALS